MLQRTEQKELNLTGEAPAKQEPVTSETVVAALRAKYSDTQRFCVLEQVCNGTGAHASSWIDVAVVSLWPSDGLFRRAFEVKVSRGDFKRELDNPGKNQWARESFHEFWFATGPNVVKSMDEIPEGCGWMEVRGQKLVTHKFAQRASVTKCGDHLIAAFARACNKEVAAQGKRLVATIKQTDSDYQTGMLFMHSVFGFTGRHGVHDRMRTQEEIFAALEKVTAAKNTEVLRQAEVLAKELDGARADVFNAIFKLAAVACVPLDNVDQWGRRLWNICGPGKKDTLKYMQENAELDRLLLERLGVRNGNEQHCEIQTARSNRDRDDGQVQNAEESAKL